MLWFLRVPEAATAAADSKAPGFCSVPQQQQTPRIFQGLPADSQDLPGSSGVFQGLLGSSRIFQGLLGSSGTFCASPSTGPQAPARLWLHQPVCNGAPTPRVLQRSSGGGCSAPTPSSRHSQQRALPTLSPSSSQLLSSQLSSSAPQLLSSKLSSSAPSSSALPPALSGRPPPALGGSAHAPRWWKRPSHHISKQHCFQPGQWTSAPCHSLPGLPLLSRPSTRQQFSILNVKANLKTCCNYRFHQFFPSIYMSKLSCCSIPFFTQTGGSHDCICRK